MKVVDSSLLQLKKKLMRRIEKLREKLKRSFTKNFSVVIVGNVKSN